MKREAESHTSGARSSLLGVPVSPSLVRVPSFVELQTGSILKYGRPERGKHFWRAQGVSAEGALDRFITLRRRSEADILDFARNRGVLLLCKHERPHTHQPDGARGGGARTQARACTPCGKEPIRVWRELSKEAGEAIAMAVRLHRDEPLTNEEEPRFSLYYSETDEATNAATIGQQRVAAIQEVLDRWMRDSGARLVVNYRREGVELDFEHPGSLYGALAIQLFKAVARAASIALCSNCGRPFPLLRRPRKGQRIFCPFSECRKAAQRLWTRESRQKTVRLKSSGTNAAGRK